MIITIIIIIVTINIYMYVYTYTYNYTCVCMHIYIYIYIYTYQAKPGLRVLLDCQLVEACLARASSYVSGGLPLDTGKFHN